MMLRALDLLVAAVRRLFPANDIQVAAAERGRPDFDASRVGRCGQAPFELIWGLGHRHCCVLPAGHPGWHKCDHCPCEWSKGSAADPRAAERPSAPTSPPGAGGHPSTPDTEDLNGDPEVELALARIELGRAHARLARYAQTYGPLPE